MKQTIRGQIRTKHRFLWQPVDIRGDKRWLKWAYIKQYYDGNKWLNTNFMPSGVGKAMARVTRLEKRSARAYDVQEKAYKRWKNGPCRRTTQLHIKIHDQKFIVEKLGAKYATD